jgi:IS30 family transposase
MQHHTEEVITVKIRWKERQLLEAMYCEGVPIVDIAHRLGVHKTSIYRELDRGCTYKTLANGRIGYSADIAQAAARGPGRKRVIAKTFQRSVENV